MKELRFFWLPCLLLSLQACTEPNFRQMLAGTERIEISFYKDEKKRVDPEQTFFIQERDLLKNFIKTVTREKIQPPNCAVQGMMKFDRYRIGLTLLKAEFNMQQACAFIIFNYQEKKYCFKIPKDDLELLELAKIYRKENLSLN